MSVESVDPRRAEKMVGSPIQRREDPALVTGEAQYTDDFQPADRVYMEVLRSPHAHAVVKTIDPSDARSTEGVLDVFTFDDIQQSGAPGEIKNMWELPGLNHTSYPILARNKVRYQGQPVAVVVAEDRYVARDAVESIEVEYEILDAVTDPEEALKDHAPRLHDTAPNNRAYEWEIGDRDATDRVFEEADVTVECELVNQRLIANAMEPMATMADYRPAADHLTVHISSQCPHLHRRYFNEVLGLSEQKMRVIAPEVGGGFGSKDSIHPAEALTVWCAWQLRRPVKWQASRAESYLTGGHGRAHKTTAEMALDADGTMRALRVRTLGHMGGYLSTFGPLNPTYGYAPMLPGVYDLDTMYCQSIGVFTNTLPTEPYRGAGRPEASYVIERLTELAARKLEMDPAELRRNNFIPSDSFPFETVTGFAYDSGDYEKTLDRALEMVDYEELRRQQKKAREQGRYLGIGLSTYIESCGYGPSQIVGQIGGQMGLWESGQIRFHPSGKVTAYCGTSGHGQGHETTYAQVIAEELGIPYEDINVIEGDTDEVSMGMGTYGSRSITVGGSALVTSARRIVEKARRIAAHHLEADVEDVEFEDGTFAVKGVPERSVTIQDVALQAYLAHDMPEDEEPGLESTSFYDPENLVFPFGAHVAVVEVDPETGEIDLLRYVAVDDCGNQINPKIVEGQVHGAIAQGLGQALFEDPAYDEDGNLTAGTLMDYTLPKTTHLPDYETDTTVTPCPHNPLGVKGVGEAGTIAAPQAVVNAVTDALQPFGIDHIDMPLTSQKVWEAIASS